LRLFDDALRDTRLSQRSREGAKHTGRSREDRRKITGKSQGFRSRCHHEVVYWTRARAWMPRRLCQGCLSTPHWATTVRWPHQHIAFSNFHSTTTVANFLCCPIWNQSVA